MGQNQKGKFDVDIMTSFLVIMVSIFRDAPAGPFTPDNAVKTYNRDHYKDKFKLDPTQFNMLRNLR